MSKNSTRIPSPSEKLDDPYGVSHMSQQGIWEHINERLRAVIAKDDLEALKESALIYFRFAHSSPCGDNHKDDLTTAAELSAKYVKRCIIEGKHQLLKSFADCIDNGGAFTPPSQKNKSAVTVGLLLRRYYLAHGSLPESRISGNNPLCSVVRKSDEINLTDKRALSRLLSKGLDHYGMAFIQDKTGKQ